MIMTVYMGGNCHMLGVVLDQKECIIIDANDLSVRREPDPSVELCFQSVSVGIMSGMRDYHENMYFLQWVYDNVGSVNVAFAPLWVDCGKMDERTPDQEYHK